ncbi:EscU/YscU/HrcU family type III secretion system export apparatus switch protein [Acetobacterium sp. K1/6]|uniref:EscU/YscU/HrcU family type III secretion system export apparatus switch protein n=1 Tax=Acetobacterium sp. K1/6 TaxID=3055467 RepID=UPI002ACA49B5|nr:EscU/YscU/HrcU family type III secretion system export apparatus switch protein [Acetobacterium sp. K1/6]MDZ5726213.1 EscU/YscU/HrcU family type III secretion system export apparatus switch protein [Acetobacterium sp. K1/6]
MSPSKAKKAPKKNIPIQDGQTNNATPEAETREQPLKVTALRYDPDKNSSPVIVAAGTGFVAQNILSVAEENGIPIYHDDSAATLLSKLQMGQEIPPELFQIVVNIYVSLLNLAEGNDVDDKLFD